MVLHNRDYVSSELIDAVERNSWVLFEDQNMWFYKKWRGLMLNTGNVAKLEFRLEGYLRDIKDSYRKAYEIGVIPYPSSVSFAAYKSQMGDKVDPLMEVLRRLPKGGLLHVHSAAALSAEGLIDLLKEWDGAAIYIVVRGRQEGKLTYTPPEDRQGEEAVGDKMLLQEYLQYVGAEARLKEWLTIGPHTDTVSYIWDVFNQIFMRTSDLFENRDFYKIYHRRFFLECLRDRIDYVELRCGFQNFIHEGDDVQKDVILDLSPEFLDVLLEAKEEAVAEYRANVTRYGWKLPYGDMGLGVILCARRDLDPQRQRDREKLMKKIDTAIVWKQQKAYQKLIKGFDFVSEEDRGVGSYAYYKDIFYGEALGGYTAGSAEEGTFTELQAQHGMKGVPRVKAIELMLHAGESLWMEQENIIDAKIASKSRIGHGFQLLEYPGALKGYWEGTNNGTLSGPVLEVCPISNQMLRYFPDIRDHYALMLMKMGVPCVLANDDPQILGNPGLSYDFWETYLAADGGLMMLKGLVFTAFVFHYQDRREISLEKWNDEVYDGCLQEFEEKYWRPFLEETREYFEDPNQ